MMPRKKRRTIYISVVSIVLIIIVTICIVLYSTTDMFKSNEELFQKYAVQLLNNIQIVFNEEHIKEMEEILKNNKLTSNTDVKIYYSEGEDISNPINNIQMYIKGQEEKASGYKYKDITLAQNEQKLVGVEYIESNNLTGIRLNGIKQYVTTNLEKNNDNEFNSIYKLMNTNVTELLTLKPEEWENVKDKYVAIILQNLKNVSYSKQKGIVLEINEMQYMTNMYSLTLTKEQYNNMYIQVLQKLKEEEMILSKIEAIDNHLNEYHKLKQDGQVFNMKQMFIEKIDNKIQEIQNFNIGNNERTISIFESNGVPISLSVDTEEEVIGLDIINAEGMNFINFLGNKKPKEGEEENSFNFSVNKTSSINKETFNVQYNTVKEGKKTINEWDIERKMENSKVNTDIGFTRKVEQNTLQITTNTIIDIINQFEEKKELIENENNIIIENVSEEQRQIARNAMKQNWLNQEEGLWQLVTLDNINNMLTNMKLKKEKAEEISGQDGVTEVEKNRFNSTFELFEGEHIIKERVKELINIAKEDLKDVRISNFREQGEEKVPLEYRLVIEKGTNNVALAENVITYIEEKYSEDFSVKLEYDDETGFINNIYIIVMQNE